MKNTRKDIILKPFWQESPTDVENYWRKTLEMRLSHSVNVSPNTSSIYIQMIKRNFTG